MSEIDPVHGLTAEELEVDKCLARAAVCFQNLPVQHNSDLPEFVNSIHRCQEILAVRIARREYPLGWPSPAQD